MIFVYRYHFRPYPCARQWEIRKCNFFVMVLTYGVGYLSILRAGIGFAKMGEICQPKSGGGGGMMEILLTCGGKWRIVVGWVVRRLGLPPFVGKVVMRMTLNDLLLMIGLAELVLAYIMVYIAVLMYRDSKGNDDDKNNRP